MSHRFVLPAVWLAIAGGIVLRAIRPHSLRERFRTLVRQLYHGALHAVPRTAHRPRVSAEVAPALHEPLENHGFDVEATAWAAAVLEGRPRSSASADPEAAHDQLRLRGVLPLLADAYVKSRSVTLRNQMLALIRDTSALISARPAIGWDTTTAALRAFSVLQARERLVAARCDFLGTDPWLSGFIAAHEPVLAVGRVVEAVGNHRAINTAGRCAVALLLDPGPLDSLHGRELAETLRGQFLSDGGHVERAPHYHLELLALSDVIVAADRGRGGRLDAQLTPVLAPARAALATMTGPDGYLLRFSDASRSFTGASQRRALDRLLGESPNALSARRSLDDFGLHTIRRRAGSHEFFLAVDCGPLGLDGNPGHGHADAMAFTLHVDGQPLLVDPGTYLYADAPAARWFKLPEAHNTIHWPDSLPYELVRFFRWARFPATPRLLDRSGSLLTAEQSWRASDRTFRHRRTLSMTAQGLTIDDSVETGHTESCVARLILHPNVRAQRRAGGRAVLIEMAGCAVEIAADDGAPPLDVVDCDYAAEYGTIERTQAMEWRLPPAGGNRGLTVRCRVAP